MDNFVISVTSRGKSNFKSALEIAFRHNDKATHYKVTKKYGLILYWADDDERKSIPLPYEMGIAEVIPFVWGWLEKQDYGKEPDHDGDNEKGYTIFNEDWGHVEDSPYGIVAIKPEWAMLGK